jgi:hypothetical protein
MARNKNRARQGTRQGRMARVMSIGALVVSVGTALYRFRRQWVPKAEEMGEALREKMKDAKERADELRDEYMPVLTGEDSGDKAAAKNH